MSEDLQPNKGYMDEKEQFAEGDLVFLCGVIALSEFMNIYDKGYRAKAVAHRAGKQLDPKHFVGIEQTKARCTNKRHEQRHDRRYERRYERRPNV